MIVAQMKHLKSGPEKSKTPKAPQPRVRLSGDRAFKAALAREYGVTEVPRRLQRRTKKTLESLPDTLPVRRRPVLRAVRSLAAAAAVLTVTVGALLNLNAAHPGLTEALPGLGRVFAAMNGHESPNAAPSASPSPSPKPDFAPVTVLSKGDFPGVLSVDDAWSDGKGLYLELSISPYDDFYAICRERGSREDISLWPAAIRYNDLGEEYVDNSCSLTVYSDGEYHWTQGDAFPNFTSDGGNKLRAKWHVDLDGLKAGEELKVDISMPDITARMDGYDDSGLYTWSSGFETTFTLPVSRSGNRTISQQAADGPVTLRSVDYSQSRVELDVSMPYLGLMGDLLAGNGDDYPLGFYARLSCQGPDGGSFSYEMADGSPESLSSTEPELSEPVELRYTFTTAGTGADPRELKGPLVLTFYEFPQDYDSPSGKVTAEFTIDLNTGRAYPSENYLEEGYEKGGASKTAAERLSEAGFDGLLLMPSENFAENINTGYDPLASFVISAPADMNGRELAVNCYLNDTVYRSFSFTLGGDFEDGADSFHTGYRSLAGGEYLDTSVTVSYPELMAEDLGYVVFDRLEIADVKTGKAIIPDLKNAVIQTREKLLGEKYHETEVPLTDGGQASGPGL